MASRADSVVKFFFNNAESWRRFLLVVFSYVFSAGVIAHLSGLVTTKSGKPAGIPDLSLLYEPGRTMGYFAEMTDAGRFRYALIELWDYFPYMWSYAFLFGTLLAAGLRFARAAATPFRYATLLPLFAVAFDIIENVGWIYCALTYPSCSESVLRVSHALATAKFASVAPMIPIFAGSLIVGVLRRYVLSKSPASRE